MSTLEYIKKRQKQLERKRRREAELEAKKEADRVAKMEAEHIKELEHHAEELEIENKTLMEKLGMKKKR